MDGPAPHTLAVVGLSGPVLRYAEVADAASAPRLRRLGAVDFAFDAEGALFGEGDPASIQAVAAALQEVLGGTAAEVLVVAAHPSVTTSFFTPLPAGLAADARDGQLAQETALLADVSPTHAVRVQAVPIRTERSGSVERAWYQVVHVGEPVHVRLSLLADGLGVPGYNVVDTARAVAATLRDAPGPALAVGAYATHTEVAVVGGGAFLFGHHGTGTTPADTAYFALDALRHAGVDAADAGRLLVYGDATDAERLAVTAEFVGRDPEPLDPFAAYGRRPDGPPAELAAFGPVLGAALG